MNILISLVNGYHKQKELLDNEFDIGGVVFDDEDFGNVIIAIQNNTLPVSIHDISKYEFNNDVQSIHELSTEYTNALTNNATNDNENLTPQDNLKAKQQVIEDLMTNNDRTDNGLTRFFIQNSITLNTLLDRIDPDENKQPELNETMLNNVVEELENTFHGMEAMTYLSTMTFEDLITLNALRKLTLVEPNLEYNNIGYPDVEVHGFTESYKLSDLIDPNIKTKGIKISDTNNSAGLFDSFLGCGAPCTISDYSVEIPYSAVVVNSAFNDSLMVFGSYTVQEVAMLAHDVYTSSKVEQNVVVNELYLDENVTNTFQDGLDYDDLDERFELQQETLKKQLKGNILTP